MKKKNPFFRYIKIVPLWKKFKKSYLTQPALKNLSYAQLKRMWSADNLWPAKLSIKIQKILLVPIYTKKITFSGRKIKNPTVVWLVSILTWNVLYCARDRERREEGQCLLVILFKPHLIDCLPSFLSLVLNAGLYENLHAYIISKPNQITVLNLLI